MPIQKCITNKKTGYKYGASGKCYTGPSAEKKAKKQGVAIEISKHANTPEKKAKEAMWRKKHKSTART